MSKSIFRWLRGELNGFYITSLHNSVNDYTAYIRDFFTTFHNLQIEEGKIDNTTLFNLGRFASVFLPRHPKASSITSLYMTDSHKVDGEEYSERGLYNTEDEQFEFYHTEADPQSDINTLATDSLRSSLVGDESVEGYISSEETDVLDSEGKVKPDKVEDNPPADEAYSEYYGNQFLFLSEGDITYESINPELYFPLLKMIQWVRYNGASIKALANIVSILCPSGLVRISKIESRTDGKGVNVFYVYNSSVDVENKEQRFSLLEYIVNLKFKQVVLVEETEE